MSLVAHYKLNGVATDASGNGHDGTPTAVTYGVGKVRQAGSLNGSTSMVDLSAHGLQLATNTSFAVWLNPTLQFGTYTPGIFSVQSMGSYNDWISLAYSAVNGHYLRLENNSGIGKSFTYFSHTVGNWLHLAMTKNASNAIRCYANGVQFGGAQTLTGYTSLSYFGRGYRESSPINHGRWAGLADDLRIYDEVLPLWKIKKIYNFGKGSEDCEPWNRLIRPLIRPAIQPLIGAV